MSGGVKVGVVNVAQSDFGGGGITGMMIRQLKMKDGEAKVKVSIP